MRHPPSPYLSMLDSYCFGLISSRLMTFIIVSISIRFEFHFCESQGSSIYRWLSLSHNAKIRIILIKQTIFQKIFGALWCFLGILGDKKGQKPNIFLKVGAAREAHLVGCWLCLPDVWRVHWLQVSGSLWLIPSFRGVFPPFVRFPALRLVGCLQIWLYFAF